mmetsp:Transcript_57757/g.132643  ORF Transcript_57757/g.132643 Transcript_57757/m.132643 type:complete len:351 (-) Transcript_57757:551-1603(-)
MFTTTMHLCSCPRSSLPKESGDAVSSWYFLHISKTGGHGFVDTLQQLSRSPRVNSHCLLTWLQMPHVYKLEGQQAAAFQLRANEGCASYAHSNESLATVLRRPEDHVKSMFWHCKSSKFASVANRKDMPDTPQEWVQSWSAASRALGRGEAMRLGQPNGRQEAHNLLWQGGNVTWPCYNPLNMQCRYLACKGPKCGVLNDDCVGCRLSQQGALHGRVGTTSCSIKQAVDCDEKEAMAQLTSMRFVGLTEYMLVSACIFLSIATHEVPAACNCTSVNGTFRRTGGVGTSGSVLSHGSRSRSSPSTAVNWTSELTDLIIARDMRLYRRAEERFTHLLHHEQWKQGMRFCGAP